MSYKVCHTKLAMFSYRYSFNASIEAIDHESQNRPKKKSCRNNSKFLKRYPDTFTHMVPSMCFNPGLLLSFPFHKNLREQITSIPFQKKKKLKYKKTPCLQGRCIYELKPPKNGITDRRRFF